MEEKELEQEIADVDQQVNSIVVNSPETHAATGQVVIAIDQMIKRVKEFWQEPKEKAHQTHVAICKRENEMLMPLKERRASIAKQISNYLTEQDRIRRDEQRKLDEERLKKELAERDKINRAADRAEEKGNTEKAEMLRGKADDVRIAPAIVAPSIEKTTRTEAGIITGKKDIQIIITDVKAILRAVVNGILPIGIININETKLKQAIKLQGITKLDGCEINEIISAQFRAS